MACEYFVHIKMNKTPVLNSFVFLIGFGILIWQIYQTMVQFIDQYTTFNVYKVPHESMVPAAMLVCPSPEWRDGITSEANISDKNWFFSQFFHLNYNLTLSLKRWEYNHTDNDLLSGYSDLKLGDNIDEYGKTFTVHELMSPWIGLCYGLIPDPSFKMTLKSKFILSTEFNQEGILPPVDIYLGKEKDLYSILLLRLPPEVEVPYKVSHETGTMVRYRSLKYKHLSKPNGYCKNYFETDSSIECILEKVTDCFKIIGPRRGCNCIPENIFKTQFEMYPITSWDNCKTSQEYKDCFYVMHDCHYNESISQGCPKHCKRQEYKARTYKVNGVGKIPPNLLIQQFYFETMDIETYNEVLIQDVSSFIGTVGGSLGLFIGFSFTGFLGKLIDFFIKDE